MEKYNHNLELPEEIQERWQIALAILQGKIDKIDQQIKNWLDTHEISEKNPQLAAFTLMSDGFSNCESQDPESYQQISEILKELHDTPSITLELCTTLNYTLVGMTKFLEYSGQSSNKWRDVWPYFTTFLKEFVMQYNAAKQQNESH